MEESIKNKLENHFQPTFLEVKNNSHHHAGHAGDNGSGETHFAISITAEKLKGLNRVQSHREINKILAEEFAKGLHALEIKIV